MGADAVIDALADGETGTNRIALRWFFMLRGNIDIVDLRQVAGWAQDDSQPDLPVSLLILDNDELIGRVLASRYRSDLREAGIGSGQHSFEFQFPKGLLPFKTHVLRVHP